MDVLPGERVLLHVHVYLWRQSSKVDPSILLISVRVRLSEQTSRHQGKHIPPSGTFALSHVFAHCSNDISSGDHSEVRVREKTCDSPALSSARRTLSSTQTSRACYVTDLLKSPGLH